MIDENAKRRIAERMAAAHPTTLTNQDKLGISGALLRMKENPADFFDPEVLQVASDLIVLHLVERNDVLRALRLR